ncbi:hypothetical protein WN51_02180 [Melipona quadrifasciata]|uniref:Uncharacterized protein n=1 Tax=Melipona quadrifasciata TaxID=166423 RepID=A0A0M8ZVC0_9HYME|nr:hypothetical protein WN51_02180 [Melipona quadrifasciata]
MLQTTDIDAKDIATDCERLVLNTRHDTGCTGARFFGPTFSATEFLPVPDKHGETVDQTDSSTGEIERAAAGLSDGDAETSSGRSSEARFDDGRGRGGTTTTTTELEEAAKERGRKEEDERRRRLEKEAEQEPAGEIVSPVLESKRGEKERDDRSAFPSVTTCVYVCFHFPLHAPAPLAPRTTLWFSVYVPPAPFVARSTTFSHFP